MLFSKKASCSGSSGAPWDTLALRRTPTPRQARLSAKLQILMDQSSIAHATVANTGWMERVGYLVEQQGTVPPFLRPLGNPRAGPQAGATWEEQSNLSAEGLPEQLLPRRLLVRRQYSQYLVAGILPRICSFLPILWARPSRPGAEQQGPACLLLDF